MRNLYNKGEYRTERCKHIGPYLKTLGNKKWRKTAKQYQLQNELIDLSTPLKKRRTKSFKVFRVLIKTKSRFCKRTVRTKYLTLRSAIDSIKRTNIIYCRVEDWTSGAPKVVIEQWS